MKIKNVEVKVRGNTAFIALWYPGNNEVQSLEIGLMDVRANDGIRIYFDYDRDGWAIEQPTKLSWEADEEPDPQWKEVAFIEGWKLSEEESGK